MFFIEGGYLELNNAKKCITLKNWLGEYVRWWVERAIMCGRVVLGWQYTLFFHLIAAATWLGSMLFFVFVLVPYAKRNMERNEYVLFLNDIGIKFRKLGWICLITIAITGILLSDIISGWDAFMVRDGHSEAPASTIAWKMVGGAILFLLAALHDFKYGPRAVALWIEEGDSEKSRKARKKATNFGRINLILSIIIFWLGITVIRGSPF